MNKFEYMTIEFKNKGAFGNFAGGIELDVMQKELNSLGVDGWELVTTTATARDVGSTKSLICVLKKVCD